VTSDWLTPLLWADFEHRRLHATAWARPSVAKTEADRFGWLELDQLLRTEPLPDVLVVARGELLRETQPRSLVALRRLMARGAGVCVRRTERQHPVLTDIASRLHRQSGRQVHAQIFATPRNTHGFSWHYDTEHVLIIQTAGVKDYYFRENTVAQRSTGHAMPDFSRVRCERSPLHTARLLAGDCLYLPARWWHMARCIDDSLSISLGLSE